MGKLHTVTTLLLCSPADGTRPGAFDQNATSFTRFPRARLLTDSFRCFPIHQRLPGQRLSARGIAHSSRAVEILPLRPHGSTESSHPSSNLPLCSHAASRVFDPHWMTRRYTNRFHLLSPRADYVFDIPLVSGHAHGLCIAGVAGAAYASEVPPAGYLTLCCSLSS
jgi:hypothetical protein